MKGAGQAMLLALLVLAAAGAVGSALYMLLLVCLVLGALFYPREALGFAGIGILMALAERHGLALLGLLGFLALLSFIARQRYRDPA